MKSEKLTDDHVWTGNKARLWKEVAQIPRLETGMFALVTLLHDWFDVQSLLLGRFHTSLNYLESITAVRASGPRNNSHRKNCTAEEILELHQLFVDSSHLNIFSTDEMPGCFSGFFSEISKHPVVFLPVGQKEENFTFVLLEIAGKNVSEAMKNILQESAEVIVAILDRENDHRKLIQQREAIEAEKQALLKKLGREKVVENMVGANRDLKTVVQRLELICSTNTPVLLLGETGTGKELIARTIHQRSLQSEKPFLRVNCGAIPPDLISRHLFGEERTQQNKHGGNEIQPGWLERTDGGTLFLDDIHELPMESQFLLRNVIAQGELTRVGGFHPVKIDVRIITATDQDFGTLVSESRFCETLWYQLAVFPIRVPTLRERTNDLPELAEHFAKRAAMRFGLPLVLPTQEDILLLQNYSWPGNVRELGTVMDRAAILGNGRKLDIAAALGVPEMQKQKNVHSAKKRQDRWTLFQSIEPLEELLRKYFEYVLEVTDGKIEGNNGAAALLELNPNTLRAKMKKLGIHWKKFKSGN